MENHIWKLCGVWLTSTCSCSRAATAKPATTPDRKEKLRNCSTRSSWSHSILRHLVYLWTPRPFEVFEIDWGSQPRIGSIQASSLCIAKQVMCPKEYTIHSIRILHYIADDSLKLEASETCITYLYIYIYITYIYQSQSKSGELWTAISMAAPW